MRIALLGAESTGKTTLAHRLADRLHGIYVPEYGRLYSERHSNDSTALDLAHIAAGQLLAEEEAARALPGRPLICDTDVLTTCTFAQLYLGECPETLWELAALRRYDYSFLLLPTLPHQQDDIRLFGHQRHQHTGLLRAGLQRLGRSFQFVGGTDLEARLGFILSQLR